MTQQNIKQTAHANYPVSWVLEKILNNLFGFTRDQIQKYRANGLWCEGIHFRRNPANRIVYNIIAINDWMQCK
jgi:hypothetical protein